MENIYKVEIITRSEKLNVLKESLYTRGIKGMSVSNVMGAGNQKGKVEIYRGSETTIDLIPKVKVEILTKESMLELVIKIARECLNTGKMGDGKIIVLPVLNVIRIRTGEEGEDAI